MTLTLAAVTALTAPLAQAQEWNDEGVLALVERGIGRRAERQADSSVQDFHVQAHGFVFFLAQLAEGLEEPPRLVKSDELVLDVYWKAPNLSKQRIIGWRDRRDLPTDIQYHQDHLGIVLDNFGDRITIGEGDEIQDVPHPLSPAGPAEYDFALVDSSLTIWLPERAVRLFEVRVRPKDFSAPRVVGNLYFDIETAELVIFRFSFTRSAYLDDTLEDITIVLENGLWEGRHWLPYRQELEIRRRTKMLDMPARGIIRGRWEVQDYEFNLGLPTRLFLGSPIVAAPQSVRDSFVWDEPIHAAIQEMAGPAMRVDLEEARLQIAEAAGARAISGLATARLGIGSISDLLHFNRVEGLAPGLGAVLRPGGGPAEVHVWASYGVSDQRFKGLIEASYESGGWKLHALAHRRIIDVADDPAISPLLNTLLAQELGNDYGDYVLSDKAELGMQRMFGVRGSVGIALGLERTTSVEVRATPATGVFRPNASLGIGTLGVGRLTWQRRSAELAVRGGITGSLALEGGIGEDVEYVRVRATGRAHASLGATQLVTRVWGGWGSAQLPPHRSFMLGGRGTLVGEPFRAWGGRYALYGGLEWQVPVPAPEIPLGPLVTTGRRLVLAPFIGFGWAGGQVEEVDWRPAAGVRPVVGVGLEWFHRFLRADLGVSLRTGDVSLVVDVTKDLWNIL
ncbi:MAG: hypothetical protein PVH40_06105 [Gemmatimonadales bacterium]|jgi:hypothetical protein